MTNDWNEDPWDVVDVVPAHSLEEQGITRGPSRPLVLIVVSVFLALVLIAGGGSLWYLRQVNPVGDPASAVNFTVTANDTLSNVSSRLEKEKIITSARVFRWYVGRKGGITFYPGYFLLKPHDHMGNIMSVLNTPPAQTFTNVTFPEGFTLDQMASRLAEKVPRLDAANFLQQSVSGFICSKRLHKPRRFVVPRHVSNFWRRYRYSRVAANGRSDGASGTTRRHRKV